MKIIITIESYKDLDDAYDMLKIIKYHIQYEFKTEDKNSANNFNKQKSLDEILVYFNLNINFCLSLNNAQGMDYPFPNSLFVLFSHKNGYGKSCYAKTVIFVLQSGEKVLYYFERVLGIRALP